jgi:hypothetical protein
MKGKWMIAPTVLAALVPVSLHVSGHATLAQQGAGNPDRQALIEKSFGPTKEVEVRDPFYNNMVAYTMTIPKDWVFEGTVLHGPACNGLYYPEHRFSRLQSGCGVRGTSHAPAGLLLLGRAKCAPDRASLQILRAHVLGRLCGHVRLSRAPEGGNRMQPPGTTGSNSCPSITEAAG